MLRWGGGLLVAVLVAVLLWWWQRDADSESVAPATSTPSAVDVTDTESASATITASPSAASTRTASIDDRALIALRQRWQQSSLRGTEADGELSLDASGHLRLDAGLLRRFDYYLSLSGLNLSGEFSLAEIRYLLAADLREQYDDAMVSSALDAFGRYLGLREAVANANLSDDPAQRLAMLRALQRAWFGDDADALFSEENALLTDTVARREIQSDPDLSEAERAQQLAELDAQRSPFERESRREANAARLVDEQTRQFEQLGMDEAARHEERAALWGEDAADRLAALDQHRADWDRRLGDYADSRQRILDNASLSPEQRQQALTRLRETGFDANEQLRIDALERTGTLPGG
ncbi:MAG: lipase secretion chaperone [Lysobacteraceae bacterium]